MYNLVISISWEYFLGVIGSLIGIAYYASGRFTRIETNLQWLADAVRDLTIRAENVSAKLFDTSSPVALTPQGRRFLQHSGLKSYIDSHKTEFVSRIRAGRAFNAYSIQQAAFRILAAMNFDESFARRLNHFAFTNGISTDLLRRVGAIYLRDLAVKHK